MNATHRASSKSNPTFDVLYFGYVRKTIISKDKSTKWRKEQHHLMYSN